MYKNKKIIAAILARGGSKGLPGKNIKPMLGKPLLGYTLEQAKLSKYIDKIIISTDDPKIAKVANKFGIKTPFLRPRKFAKDNSPSSDALLHVIAWYEKKQEKFDVLILLEPTSPLRKKTDIDNAIKLLIDNYSKADSLLGLGEIASDTHHPFGAKTIERGYIKSFIPNVSFYQRQELPKSYGIFGGIYVVKTEVYKKTKDFLTDKTIPFIVERWQEFEIDDPIDWICTEAVMEKFLV